ncbi:MAG TPA: hypothetical protein VKW04_20100 [Planctomycetota bacterium]|nr:hypothetical protein [Planctomycetota bacterium]
MKSSALAIVALAALGAPLLAQDYPDPSRRRPPYGSSSSGYGWSTGSSGYLGGAGFASGYGSGYGGGWLSGGWGSGFVTGFPGWGTMWAGSGGYYGYGLGGGYPSEFWGGDRYYGRPHYGSATAAGPMGPPQPPADRTPQSSSLREIEEGRRRFHVGDYHGALDAFRSAVVATTDSPVAQAWFAVCLIAVGDGRNADKAIRTAASGGLSAGALSLDGQFRDEKERVRMIVTLAKVGSEGSLAAAYALSLAGEPARLRQLAEKDPAARLLLPKP